MTEETGRAGEVAPAGDRRIVFVVGSGRSGTSTMAVSLQTLGMHVPQPEVEADETNPRGFGEPQWVVDLHERLLRRANVQVSDARPQAWLEAGRLAHHEKLVGRVAGWLEEQFAEGGDELVVKDPRLAWFQDLWTAAALRAGATPSYITMLRPPTEVVGSKQKYYGSRAGEVSRTAAWVNMMLGTERATRGTDRAMVRYHDLLSDWTVPVTRIGEELRLEVVRNVTPEKIRRVHNFIDPDLRRVQLGWDDVSVPDRLRELAQATWDALDLLATPGEEGPALHARFDSLRAEYAALYEEAESIALSSQLAARQPVAQEQDLLGQRVADRLPHGVRALVPRGARRRVKASLNRRGGA